MKVLNSLRLIVIIYLAIIITNINLYSASYFFTYNGHTYEIVKEEKSWYDAATFAAGKGGYLVHIESIGEQNAVWSAITTGALISPSYTIVYDGGEVAYIWIGATDFAEEGTWLWDGNNDNEGTNFWKGEGAAGKNNGQIIDDAFVNWGGTNSGTIKEPDNFFNSQDAAAIALDSWPKNNGSMGALGEWNDISQENVLYFIIEYDFIDKPGKAAIPSGPKSLCKDPDNTQYTSSGAKDAISYKWFISPNSAGTITGNATTATVDWNSTFHGTAQIYLLGINALGAGDSSNKLIVMVNSIPEKCEKPKGETSLPMNPSNKIYSVKAVNYAFAYNWKLEPTNAASISVVNDTSISLDWNNNFSGEAKLSVSAANDCGSSDYSESLIITISSNSSKPPKPTGEFDLCQGTANTEYQTDGVKDISAYKWFLTPSSAGTITGITKVATIKWNNEFYGIARVVVATNSNNTLGEFSDTLSISVNPKPNVPEIPTGLDSVDLKKTTSSIFSTKETLNAESYQWQITPKESGEIKPNKTECEVIWNKQFKGKSQISVKAINKCGESNYSETKEVEVYESTGTSVDEFNADFAIFPNPANDFIDIELNQIENNNSIKIYDLLGNLLFYSKINNINFRIDVSQFESGLYLLILSNNDKSWQTTFMKR